MAGRQYFFAGSTVLLLLSTGLAVAMDEACSPPPSVITDAGEAGVCDPDSGDPQAYCPCDPSTYKTADCYTGAAGTQSKGICQTGKRSCGSDKKLTPCVGQVTPQPEICNLADDNCDGIVDNVPELDSGPIAYCNSPACTGTYADAAIYCWGTDPGICGAGTRSCAGSPKGGTPTGCDEFIKTGVAEVCNGVDDDCNGQVDDGLFNLGNCDTDDGAVWGDASPFVDGGPSTILGQCVHGQYACNNGTQSCIPTQPGVETCNGKDDNCNGVIDEHSCTTSASSYCCTYYTGTFAYCYSSSFAAPYLDGGTYFCRLAYP